MKRSNHSEMIAGMDCRNEINHQAVTQMKQHFTLWNVQQHILFRAGRGVNVIIMGRSINMQLVEIVETFNKLSNNEASA
ncbi:hypothetical protein KIN20_004344 [Parelaphostrongylus tenuis]|uniref:Uncharacterized protein n=1 Tax=Parelaphostrongylus tenuis TaxID=148309 RepID=A0AAD5M0I4_PARTN|nr:hypothetical protein KIN20_004344 [Parelaphostrongylus tenuis]